jgi:hypothetical protein
LISFASLSLNGWADLAQIATALIAGLALSLAAASALFVWFQIKHAREETRIGLGTGMTEQMLEVDRALIEYPTMRKYFGGNADPGDDGTEESERANAIAFALANALDHVVNHLRLMDPVARDSWDDYIWNLHDTSPVFTRTLTTHKAWWPYLQAKVATKPSAATRARATFGSR